jgi:hypothetical protein
MNKKPMIQYIAITLLLWMGFASGVQAQPNQALNSPQTVRFYVWASTGPLSYLTDARITVRDAKGKLVALGKTNHRGIVGFRVRNKKLRELPLNIVTSGGKVDGIRFRSQLKARAHEVGGKNPIIYLDLVSTTARQITGPRMKYAEATSAVRSTLKINKRAAVDTLRVKNPYVDGDRLNHAVILAGGYTRFARELGRLAKLGQTMNGLEPPQPVIKTRGQSTPAKILNAALHSEQASQHIEASSVTTQSNSSTLCTTAVPGSGNTVANYGSIATASLLEVVGLPLAATEGVTGMLLSSVGVNDSSPTTEALDNVANELDCISSQLQYIEEELAEIETLVDYNTLQTELTNANNCQNGLALGWSYYNTLANQGDGTISNSNPNLCIANGGACGSGDIYDWQAEVNACGAVINNTLFGTGGGAGGSAWAQLNILYQSEYAWYTQAQTQAIQSFLSYWSTMIYYQFVLQNEVFNFYGQWANAVTFSGGPGTNGSTACAYDQPIPNINVCQWQSNIQYAFPGNLYSDEVGLWNGTAVNAYPAGLTLSTYPSTTGFSSFYLADKFYSENVWEYSASSLASTAMTDFNNLGINPANNQSAIETYDSPQALRTLIITSSTPGLDALNNAQSQSDDESLTASSFFFNAVNQINGWPTSDGWSSDLIGYYTSDNVTTTAVQNLGYDYVVMSMNAFVPASPDTNWFNCGLLGSSSCYPIYGATSPIMAVLLGRTYWTGATNATNQSFYTLLPPPLTVPNAPTITGVTAGTGGELVVAFDLVPESDDGGMSITGYVASCTATGSATPISASGTTSPINVSGLIGGTEYSCSIQAENAGGLSAIPATCPIASCSATPTDSTTTSASSL